MRTARPQIEVATVHVQVRDRNKAKPTGCTTLYETTPAAAIALLRLAASAPALWPQLIRLGAESDDADTREAARTLTCEINPPKPKHRAKATAAA